MGNGLLMASVLHLNELVINAAVEYDDHLLDVRQT